MKIIFNCFFGFILLGATLWLQNSQIQVPKAGLHLLPPPDIKNFTLGYNDMLASLFWIRALQNIDVCESGKYTEENYVPPLKDENNRSYVGGVVKRKIKPATCHLGWVYQMMDLISNIYARFKLVYDVGALHLSIVVDDREGARRIFEKGLSVYPDDWRLNFAAAYHYLWEMQDLKRSAELFQHVMKSGGPDTVSTLLAGIYAEMGQSKIAEIVLLDQLAKNPPEAAKKRLLAKLKDLRERYQAPQDSSEK